MLNFGGILQLVVSLLVCAVFVLLIAMTQLVTLGKSGNRAQ